MRNTAKLFSILLVILMTVSLLAGCGTKDLAAAAVPTDAELAATEDTADELAAQPEQKETIMIRAWGPVDWYDINVWAWKDGGEDVFEEWPGEAMELDLEEYWYKLSVPGWADRLVFNSDGGAVQTADVIIEPGKDLWVLIMDDLSVEVYYEDLWADMELGSDYDPMEDPMYEDPICQAVLQGDFETAKSLLSTLEDRSILTDWIFNDFNYEYAIENLLSGDYETAIEFFGYCAFENDQQYAVVFRQLVDGDVEGAIETKMAMEFSSLDSDLDMTWPEIICMVTGVEIDPTDTNYILMNKYLTRRMSYNQPYFSEDSLVFGEHSTWEAEGYVTKLESNDYYLAVDSLNSLYRQCGSEPNGKVLILRGQKDYASGRSYYVIDLLTMEYLSYDLYPSSLSEVEYVILADYSYNVDGRYEQTFSMGDNSVKDYFTFLRMKGRVELIDQVTGKTISDSQWITGTGEVEAHFSDLDYQCSNMPETGVYIIEAVDTVRELNAQEG